MKKNLFFAAVPAMMFAAATFSLTGCEDMNTEEPTPDGGPGADVPELTLKTTTVSAVAEEKTYTVEYSVKNAVEGAEVSASCPETWVTGIDTDKDGVISFSVEANGTNDVRSAEVTVKYAWGEGEDESVEDSFTVEQAAGQGEDPEPEPAEDPKITLSPDVLEQFPAEDYDISANVSVTVENEVEGGVLSVSVDNDWLSADIADGTVTISLDPNNSTSVRTATVTVTYTYGEDDKTVSATLEVSQAAAEAPAEIIVTGIAGDIEVSEDGDEAGMLMVSIDNAIEGGVFSLESDSDWIVYDEEKSYEMGASGKAAMLSYIVSPNETTSQRSGKLIIVYTYDTDKTITKEITVNQAAGSGQGSEEPGGETGEYAYNLIADSFTANFFGTDGNNGENGFNITISGTAMTGSGSTVSIEYFFELYSTVDPSPVLATGTYEYDESAYTSMTLAGNSGYIVDGGDNNYITQATLVLQKVDGDDYTCTVTLTDIYGEEHHITYTGPVSF